MTTLSEEPVRPTASYGSSRQAPVEIRSPRNPTPRILLTSTVRNKQLQNIDCLFLQFCSYSYRTCRFATVRLEKAAELRPAPKKFQDGRRRTLSNGHPIKTL